MPTNDQARISTRLRRAPTRYEPVQRLAAGGMAEVWKGTAQFEGGGSHPVALKRILPELATQDLYRSMFEDEARLGMMLRHPNIVRVYDAREIASTFLIVMELVEGTSLKAILDRAEGRPMPVAAALWIAKELAAALSYAHQATDPGGNALGIIHRDVSPHNLLLGKDGATKLADFGLANASVHTADAGSGMIGGKLGYLAPEVIDQKPTTPSVDVFAVGIVLWEMLCGRRLFQGKDDAETVRAVAKCEVTRPSLIQKKIPREVDLLVLEVLARDPARRTPTAAVLERKLGDLLARIDPQVSSRDISLMVHLHLATEPKNAAPAPKEQPAARFLAELQTMVASAKDADFGAAPLDPTLFDLGTRRR